MWFLLLEGLSLDDNRRRLLKAKQEKENTKQRIQKVERTKKLQKQTAEKKIETNEKCVKDLIQFSLRSKEKERRNENNGKDESG